MRNSAVKDISKVMISNVISLLSGILISFLLPKVMTVADYGYYKTFTLYISYVGLLHFGFCDGIYLKYGGVDYSDLDRTRFRTYFLVLTILEISVSLLIVFITFLFLPQDLQYIFICLAVYSILHIYGSYYQLISQATSRFKEFSNRTIIYSILRIIGVLALWIFTVIKSELVSYKPYIIITIAIEILIDTWYFQTYKAITFGPRDTITDCREDVKQLLIIGFPLLITNLTSTFLLSLDRQFVNILFPKEEYAIYAFAYNMLALVTATTSAIATVLFPKLKRASEAELKNHFSTLVSGILILVFAGLIIYFPLYLFIQWFLPQYSDSLSIFRIIFPGLATSSAISIVIYNYYKVIGKTKTYLKICLSILLVSAIANYVAYILFHTTVSISMASIVVMILWYIISERYFIRQYKITWANDFFYMLIMMITFYLVTCIPVYWLGFVVYTIMFLLFLFLFQRKNIFKIKSLFK